MQVFPQKHSKRITDLHSDRGTNFISASEDGTLQFYDLRTLQPHTQLVAGSNRVPIYSVTGNQRIVASGTTEDILIWDTRSLKQPLFRFEEGHNEDVTCLEVRNEQLLSCSIDQVLNIYNLQY
jgi:WD40 repeat protein